VSRETRDRLAELVRDPAADIALGNLLIAAEASSGIDIPATLARVDALGAAARERGGDAEAVVSVLHDEGFRGDRDEYDDPANSFLHSVLDLRRGLPILLSALAIAVGRRCGADIEGVGLPGHFVIRYRRDGENVHVDAFDGWRGLTPDDIESIVRRAGAPGLAASHLAPAGTAGILMRMLANLRGSYLARRRLADVLWAVELQALIDPADPDLRTDRRAVLIGLGRYDDAEAAALGELSTDPDGRVARAARDQLTVIADLRRRMN
jgi:regulator of sirC expression with transglutaminase-like and TPR domain